MKGKPEDFFGNPPERMNEINHGRKFVWRVRHELNGSHVHCRIWLRDTATVAEFALIGELVFQREEFHAWKESVERHNNKFGERTVYEFIEFRPESERET